MKQLNELKQIVKNRWLQFSLREKKMIATGCSITFFFILYVGIWSPILNHLDDMRKRINKDEKLLAFMQGADRIMMQLNQTEHHKKSPDSLVSFLSILKQGIQAASLTKSLSQLHQSGHDAIELRFEKVNFDQAMRFLLSILKVYDVHITQFVVTALSSPGQTNIELIIRVN